jgi:hypothetical protein
MNGCPDTTTCQVIQVIEPDPTLSTAVIPSPGFDPSMFESGDVPLAINQGTVTVTFQVVKAGDYRFEYLYVDGLGAIHPGVINVIPVTQTVYGFTVNLAGVPRAVGRVLRWHVVVVTVIQSPGNLVDAPETIRVALPVNANSLVVSFVNPRSTAMYGFTELRVENVIDDPTLQSPVWVQVTLKTLITFTVGISPTPPTANYYLVARTP